MDDRAGGLFEGFGTFSDPEAKPEESTRFFGRYHRNPTVLLFALLVSGSVWPWFVNVLNLYAKYEANRRVVDPWANGSGVDDLARAASGVAASAGAATTVLWSVVVGLVIAVCSVVGLFAAYAHSTRAPRGTVTLGVALVALWVIAAVALRAVAVSSIAALGALSA